MSDIQLYLLEVDKDKAEAQKIARQSASKIDTRQVKLIELITSLEEYINNKDDATLRAKSVAYLADVLHQLSPRALSGPERRLLCDFILGRIEGDVEGVGASARALLALEDRGKWDAETAQRVMRTFVDNTNPLRQFKLQTDRYPVIQLIDRLLAKYRNAMRQLHEDDGEFMSAFLMYFEGEKDPRNLMIVFSLLKVPMAEWDIHGHAQDMFEAVFNYFPITFKPPPDDPYGITAQDLKDRLRDCIAANSEFAPHAFPALLDKLDSTSMNTKRDVLQTFKACIAGYGTQVINLYSVTLWDALKFEILNVQEEDLAEEALQVISGIAKKFSEVAEGPLLAYLRPIIKECNEHLEDAPTKQSHAAARILYSVCTAHPTVADRVAKGVLPALFTLYHSTNSIAKKRGLLEVFNQIVKAYSEGSGPGHKADPEALQAFAEDALNLMLLALVKAPKAEVSFRLAALHGLTQLTAVPDTLSESQVIRIVDAVTQLILHERIDGHGDIRGEAIKALVSMSHSVPEVVRNQAIPAFMVELPDVCEDEGRCEWVLEAFAQLSSEQQMFDTVALRIKSKLSAARHQHASMGYQRILLLALLYVFTFGSPIREDGIIRSAYFTEYAEPLMDHLRDSLPSERDDVATEIVGRIINIILRPHTPHFQRTVYNRNIDWISPPPDATKVTDERISTLSPFSLYYYAALRPEIVESHDILSLLRNQTKFLLGSVDNPSTSILLRHVSLLINKFLEPKTMKPSLESANLDMTALLEKVATVQTTTVAFAVAKALMIQGKSGSLTSQYIELLLQRLGHADRTFARQFAGLLAPDDILSKENHCLVSGLYQQKTFNQIVPQIVATLPSTATDAKANSLVALSGILRWLPYRLIEPSLASLVSPLLQSLDLDDRADQDIKLSSLVIFESLLMHDPPVASEHTASLITRLLNATARPGNVAPVRAKALQCLSLVPTQLKREAVVPYRRPVVKRLLACLDDAKRNVRAEAVRCRSAWLALEEGTEDDE